MKNFICIIFFFCALITTSANEIIISFQSKVDTVVIDSIHATNITKGQTVKLNSGESLKIEPATSSDFIKISDIGEGYLYPNPTDGSTTLSFNTVQSEKAYISIYDMAGKMLLNKTQSLTQGNHRFQLRFPTSGLYHVTVLTNKRSLCYKALYSGSNQQLSEIEYLGSNEINTVKSQLKSSQHVKALDYSEGDVVHYTVFSGNNITVISDKPATTKAIEVEFHECKDGDGKNYKIVQIGDQWWMAENLAHLPIVGPSSQGSGTVPYYYAYGYQGSDVAAAKQQVNYTTYGVLYNWPAAKAACPPGWHLPTDDEWKQLEMVLGMTQANATGWRGTDQGTQMKATTGWINNGNGTNSSGISALPGGYRNYYDGTFSNVGGFGFWWSSTEYDSSVAWYRDLYYDLANVLRSYDSKAYGISVRCVRD